MLFSVAGLVYKEIDCVGGENFLFLMGVYFREEKNLGSKRSPIHKIVYVWARKGAQYIQM